MEIITHQTKGSFHMLRLDKGDDILEGVQRLVSQTGLKDAVLLSGIGTLDECHMHFVTATNDPSQMEYKKWANVPLEIASVSGIIADGSPHLHMTVSTTTGAWGGHVEPGCRTLYLCEFMFMELPGFSLTRKPKNPNEEHTDFLIKMLTAK